MGGLAFSQALTLFVTPVVYTYLDSFQAKLGKLFSGVVGASKVAAPVPASGD